MSSMEWNGQQQQQTWHKKAGGSQKSAYSDEKTMKEKPYSEERAGREKWSWRGATRCEWRQSRVQMNAHLKLSPNPFTIDAVQSGRYLPHAAHCCTRMCPCQQDEQRQTTTYSPLALLLLLFLSSLSFFFWATAICLCLSGLRSTTTLNLGEVWGPQACFGFSPSFSPSPTMLTYRTTIIKPARQRCIQIELLS